MADLTYGEIESDLIAFAEANLESAPGGALRIINRAVRYIQDFYNGKWEHLTVRDYPVAFDSTGLLITLPTDFNRLYRVFRMVRQSAQEMGETEFYLEVSSPTVLTVAPTRRLHYWHARNAGEARYLSYWRLAKLFAGTDSEVPDMAGSGEAILSVAKWLVARNERNANQNEVLTLKTEAVDAIRQLKCNDDSDFAENAFDNPIANFDGFQYESYNLEDGGQSLARRQNPLLNG